MIPCGSMDYGAHDDDSATKTLSQPRRMSQLPLSMLSLPPMSLFMSIRLGLRQSSCDPCLFVRHGVIVVVYMYDILFFAKGNSKIQPVIDALKVKGIANCHEGTAEGFLAVNIECST
ncbi:hypothetical protein ACHAW6_003709 [Cyclotella cf. meneghiniana]